MVGEPAHRRLIGLPASALPTRVPDRWVVALLFLGVPLQLFRGPGVPVWRAVFGEDGGIFLTEAFASHGWSTVFEPYQGYLQVSSRLVAELVATMPLSVASLALAVVPALLVCLLSVFVYTASAGTLTSRWARIAVAVAPLILPAAYETTANATDLHWYLDYACFWALAVPHRRPALVGPAAVVAALAVLSDPLAGLFLPLAVWRVVEARAERRSALVVPGAFAVGLALQVLLGVAQQHAGQFRATDPSDVPEIYGLRVGGSFLFGDRFLARGAGSLGGLLAYACLAVVAAGTVLALRRRGGRTLVLLGVGYSVLWLAVPMLLRGTDGVLPQGPGYLGGSRYMVVPILLLVVAAAARLESSGPTPRALASVWFLLIAAVSFAMPSQRTDGPVWSTTLAEARRQCAVDAGRPLASGRSAEAPWGLPAGPTDVLIPVAPNRPHAWSVVAACRRVGAAQ